jgi:hypothetical protein
MNLQAHGVPLMHSGSSEHLICNHARICINVGDRERGVAGDVLSFSLCYTTGNQIIQDKVLSDFMKQQRAKKQPS